MPSHLIVLLTFAWLAILVGGWVGWQLLRQNGRLLLRLEELEQHLNEIEFGESEEPAGLLLGTEAPAFELADLTGGRQSLAQFHGQPVVIVFFNPECGFCWELMPKLSGLYGVRRQVKRDAAFDADANVVHPSQSAVSAGAVQNQGGSTQHPRVLLITTGDAAKNRQFFAEHRVSCPVLLQNDGEIAKAYQVNGTPAGYLVSAEGKVASELAIGAEALLKLAEGKSEIRNPKSETDQSLLTSAATDEGEGRTGRFGNRSLSRSKIKRDGLKAGTPAPDFRLPRLDGRGDLSLEEFRGRRVLLVFSSPHCSPCDTLAPELEKFHRKNNQVHCSELSPSSSHTPLAPLLSLNYSPAERPLTPSLSPGGGEGVRRTGLRRAEAASSAQADEGEFPSLVVVMISKGEPKENRAKVKEHGLTFPVVLQQQWEISRRYAMFATPIAYLINETGVIAADVAVGVEPILALLLNANSQARERELAIR